MNTQKGTQRRRARGEGTVYKDSTRDRWVGMVRIDGRVHKVSAASKAGAAEKLGKLIHGDAAERATDKRMSTAALLDEWQAKALPNRNRAPSTVERHAWACARLTTELGKVRVTNLDAPRIEKALAAMAADGLGKASLTEVRGTLRQALKWAVRRRYVSHNAADAVELPTDAKGKREKRALAPDELAALLDALDGHPWQAMYALMGRCGLRPGEAAGVCADALGMGTDEPTLAIIRAVHLEKGKPVLGDTLKTKGARRTIALPADVAALVALVQDAPKRTLLFETDGGPVWPSTVRSELEKACTAAGVTPVTPNELRHTAATNMANAGVPPHVIADVLGHTTTRMVDETYRHRPAVIRGVL